MPENFESQNQEESELKNEFQKNIIIEEFEELAGKLGITPELLASDVGNMTIQKINEEFSAQYEFPFSSEELPEVFVDTTENRAELESTGYLIKIGNVEVSAIMVKNIEDVVSGNIMAEELAHFYRFKMKPNEEVEFITNEFFGFLGRRLFGKATKKSEVLSELEDNKRGIPTKAETIELARRLKKMSRSAKSALEVLEDTLDLSAIIRKLTNSAQIVESERKNVLVHQRGYEWASRVDLDKISDWPKLFSLPNKEVRKRFFTNEPDYSGL